VNSGRYFSSAVDNVPVSSFAPPAGGEELHDGWGHPAKQQQLMQ
jgi:hypothetical protein